MTSSLSYGIVTLTIDGVMSFLQLLDVQNECKNTSFSLTSVVGNSDSRIVIDYEALNLFVC